MNKNKNAIRMEDLPPKMQAEARAQLGISNPVIPKSSVPRALQPMKEPKRIRQSSKPLMNGLETQFFSYLQNRYPDSIIQPQATRQKLANGSWYKVDFIVFQPRESLQGKAYQIMAFEVKGPHAFRGGYEYLKIAASLNPHIKYYLVWKGENGWIQQPVMP
jgi:hypothetical protein